ncbi:enoyl-CoA hydratase/isomerase family protein [Mesobacillus foraminis]|uniref:Enoyl-CoA hydratase/carnithine racemase n=1 Tax=Mesobacillus foraminis TaxID=279826 RepID=A0A4R2BIG2_9BACI|nr:enoyl-CoA hydratase/isomerase family protein [Mesobacillus foraminis]TCN25724.1 enoyl-CoA hydratase/carnithine racemase [Mesobacillus foraminis]
MEYLISKGPQGLLIFTINRQEKRNAVNYKVMEGLEKAVQEAASPDVKALVITGNGDKAFCSGGDLSVFHELKTEEEAFGMLSKMSRIIGDLLMLPKPTVALINGAAVGGGCEIAAACDFRIGKQGIQAGFIQGNLAITTGWGGGTILLEKLSASKALKMLTDARLYSAGELKELGFLDSIYEGDHMENCSAFLEQLLDKDGAVLTAYKEMLRKKWANASVLERMEEEVKNCAALWEKEVHHEKVASFLKK